MPVYITADGALEIERQSPPVRITLDSPAVQPGQTLTLLRESQAGAVFGPPTPPPGWPALKAADDRATTVTVPNGTPLGRYTITNVVRIGETEFVVPIEVEVVPRLLRG
ncbi:MAG: hypothetical protein JSV19_13940 [Phycisphaerales bacterium]|nr:MAG: hypothetical protein JSV19_13940 [Phycisphaerales bacterium]